nr:tuberous sclerosis 1 protein like [Quercus suber]
MLQLQTQFCVLLANVGSQVPVRHLLSILMCGEEEHRTLKDATRALQTIFRSAKVPPSLPADTRTLLREIIEGYDEDITAEESTRANAALKEVWDRHMEESPNKAAVWTGVLRELQPAIMGDISSTLEWWETVARPVITSTGHRKVALEDAQHFTVQCMLYEEDDRDEDGVRERARLSKRLLYDLLNTYLARTRGITDDDPFIAPENAQVAQQVETMLITFGKKQPKDLFHSLDDLVMAANTRLQGLTLLSTFLKSQTPHLYLVINTPLVEHLLKCLVNDTSTAVLSVALTSLIMLLPHIPGSLPSHLPRLFIIYSRLLCWEKFSPLSDEAQRSLVTDDRIVTGPDVEDGYGDVGVDMSWDKAAPKPALIETSTPELMTYFTYLYGMYPLNFMSYVRKPWRYLKNVDFPGADDFDLDQAVIRSRTEQFRQVHLAHPNFYNLTIEEELIDPKWPKSDPADVVAECNGLCINGRTSPLSPGPPPSGKLPEIPPLPPMTSVGTRSGGCSPSISHASFKSGTSWRDNQSTALTASVTDLGSPAQSPSDEDVLPDPLRPRSKGSMATSTPQAAVKDHHTTPQSNLAFLQRENTLLRNQLNFEQWHKAQYSQHIGQIMRKNVKDATAEAENLNLLNANRALKSQVEQIRSAREATIKDSSLRGKQANNLEANLSDRLNKMKKEQEAWHADADELRRLRSETKQYRDLLVAAEARELNKSHQIEIIKRDLGQMRKIQSQLQDAQQRLGEYEYRDFEFERAKRESEILQHEKETLQIRIRGHEQERERTKRAHSEKVAELEAQLDASDSYQQRRQNGPPSSDVQSLIQNAIADSQTKLAQLKKVHARLLERFTDLEMEYQAVKSQLENVQSAGFGRRPSLGLQTLMHEAELDGTPRDLDSPYEYTPRHDYDQSSLYTVSNSDPTSQRYAMPFQMRSGVIPSPPVSEAAVHSSAGLTFRPPPGPSTQSQQTYRPHRTESSVSHASSQPVAHNQTAPLGVDERSVFSGGSDESASKKKDKIKPDSQVRVYGRGGAQNIKLKDKGKDRTTSGDKPAKSGGAFSGLKRML